MANKIVNFSFKKPGLWLTATRKLEKGVWPWTTGVRARIPKHYKIRYVEKHMIEPTPVHYRPEEGRWKLDKWGMKRRIQNIPIPVMYPPEADEGLWGGEGIVEGMKKKNNDPRKGRYPNMWRPGLMNRLFYSEILDKHMSITVTMRTLDQIDECYGFDYYILKTHEVNLKSKLGMKLKRQMLVTLARRTLYPNNPAKREEIYEKYKEFILPEEEAEWLGLTIEEAEYKQEQVEEEERLNNLQPQKNILLDELAQQLKDGTLFPEEKESSFISKLNPFKKQSEQKET